MTTKSPILPPETLTNILSSVELLSAMWSGTDELTLSPSDETTIQLLAEYLQLPIESLGSSESVELKDRIGEEVVLGLKVRGEAAARGEDDAGVWVNIGLKLRGNGGLVRMWVSSADAQSWLDRDLVGEINSLLSKSISGGSSVDDNIKEDEDLVGIISNAIEGLSEFLLGLPTQPPSDTVANSSINTTTAEGEIEVGGENRKWVRRTWYYLPSLSTPSKRKDIVLLALSSHPPLSGFLLAGKPGLIVIEYPLTFPVSDSSTINSTCVSNAPAPSSAAVAAEAPAPTPTLEQNLLAAKALFSFWSTIKTTSWSDIPPAHKKISEKLTEEVTFQAFSGFNDITDWPETERGPDRGRKSDLSKLVVWLDAKGVKGKWVLERCLGVGGWES